MSSVGSSGRDSSGQAFGALLRDHRVSAGLTQKKLAEWSGLSERAIRDLERGRVRVPQRESLEALIVVLGLDSAVAETLVEAARAARSPRRLHSAVAVVAEMEEGTGEGTGKEGAGGAWTVPGGLCALPSGVADFTGRAEELGRLRAWAGRVAEAEAPSAVVISAISGQGGIGKTALALQVGHELAGQFPDACLYVDLRGMDPQPADPEQVLGSFLSTLGLPEELIPDGVRERSARFRSLLFRRRALVVLDNAADEAQVRPLLPGGPLCVALVTSRSVLAGLETPHRLMLGVFTPSDAVALLAEIIGQRATAEPEATAEVAALCGYLPLALRIAGNRLARRPGWSMGFLARRLRDEHARLRELQAGDLQVRAAFALSYGHASRAARLVFRRLSLVPGPDFGSALAAVLAGTGEKEAETVLEELADASLILPAPTPDRYRFHDLVRLFAGERLHTEEDEPGRRAVEDRMLDWLLGTAVRAGELFYPPGEARTTEPAPPVTTSTEAGSWLEAEWANWTGAVRRATSLRRHSGVCAVTMALGWYFSACGGLRGDWRELHTLGVEAARHTGDLRAEARHLYRLGLGHARHARRLEDARECYQQALVVAREAGDRRDEGWALTGLAWMYATWGRFVEALDCGEAALAFFRADGYRVGEVFVLQALGVAHGRSRRFAEAVDYHRQALVIARAVDYRVGEGAALQFLGGTFAAMGRLAEAVDCLQPAVTILDAEEHVWWEGLALRHLGMVLHELGRLSEAAEHHQRAVTVFEATGVRYDKAKALCALGATARELGDTERARECWQEALEICEQLDLPQAEQVRELMTGQERYAGPGLRLLLASRL